MTDVEYAALLIPTDPNKPSVAEEEWNRMRNNVKKYIERRNAQAQATKTKEPNKKGRKSKHKRRSVVAKAQKARSAKSRAAQTKQ